jgi:disulfide bond formation protein DsbB
MHKKWLYGLNLALNLSIVTAAFWMQWYWQLLACPMCYYQRYAYIVAAVISLAALWLQAVGNSTNKATILLGLCYFTAFCMALIQVLTETGLIAPPSFCSAVDATKFSDLEDFKHAILSNQDAPCNADTMKIFGISFAGYSAVFAAVMLLLLLIVDTKQNHTQKKR